MNTSINLKNLLHRIWEVKQGINEIYDWVKHGLGEDADFIRDWADLRRVERDGTESEDIEGDALFEDVLQVCWKTNKDYVWHYHGSKFRVSPFKSGTTDDGGFIFYYGEKHSLITFAGVVRDSIDTDSNVWEVMVARMFGLADGYTSASLRNPEVLEQAFKDGRLAKPAPDAEVAEDLKWKDGYSVDPEEVVKVPEGADGTLACADPDPVGKQRYFKALSASWGDDEVVSYNTLDDYAIVTYPSGHNYALVTAIVNRSGIYRPGALLDEVEKDAKERGKQDVLICTRTSTDKGTLELFKRCGYEPYEPETFDDGEPTPDTDNVWLIKQLLTQNYAVGPEPCPEEVPAPAEPVIDQAEERVIKSKKNLIRAGGGPDDDKGKDGYLKWKQSLENPQRFG